MKKLLLLVISLLCNVAFSQSGWYWANPLPQGNNLSKVIFANENTGFSFGDNGVFLRTTNGGVNWTSSRLTPFCINSMFFINSNTGYISASARILKTTNSGLNWFNETNLSHAVFTNLYFMNENTGYATGDYSAYIYKTTNGGKAWWILYTGTTQIRAICFLNSSTGFAVGHYSTVIKTLNGGNNWSVINYSPNGYEFKGIAFADSLNGSIIDGTGHITSTRNGGANWTYVTSFPLGNFNEIKFINQNTGAVCGNYGQGGIIQTTNGGLNWTANNSLGHTTKSLDYINPTLIFSVSDEGRMFRTTNSGTSWDTISKSFTGYINCVSFVDSLTGWMAGGNILKTTNGGNNWFKQINTAYGIKDMHFINSTTGFAIGYINAGPFMNYYRTTNGGNNWLSVIDYPIYGYFNGVSAISKDTVFFVSRNTAGLNGYIYRSLNGGSNWTLMQSFTEQQYGIRFTDSFTGYVCGRGGQLFKTTNAGVNWFSLQSGTLSSLFRMQFLNSNTGWAFGSSGTIIKTTNGGINWVTQLYLNSGIIYINGLNFINQNTGVAIGICSVDSVLTYVTSNGGTNWNYVNNITSNLIDVAFINPQKIIAVGNGGRVIYSNSMGYSVPNAPNLLSPYNNSTSVSLIPNLDWSDVQYTDTYNVQISKSNVFDSLVLNANSISVSNFQIGPCTLNRNTIYYWRVRATNFVGTGDWSQVYNFSTKNIFYGWNQQLSSDTLSNNSIYMLDSLKGWIAGEKGKILKTETGGDCWFHQNSSISKNLNSICFINSFTGWSVGDSGAIIKTTNSGNSWINLSLSLLEKLNSISFISTDTGWIVGNNGKLFKSVNAGHNWNQINLGMYSNINSIKFINSFSGWICGESGTVYNTTNGGENWSILLTNTTSYLNSIAFIDYMTGWTVGQSGLVLKTTNGGVNWFMQNSKTTSNLNYIYFTSANRGWIAGDDGYLIGTKTAGTDWLVQKKIGVNKLKSVSFTNIENGWVCGSGGLIYFTQNGSNITTVLQNSSEIPSYYKLNQNFPNPFNPTTKIEYAIPRTCFVKIVVYNVLGREVAIIVNEILKAGMYETIFNGTHLSNGIYYYRIISEDYNQTRKMVLLK